MRKPEGRHLHIEINEDTGVVRWRYEQVVRCPVLQLGGKTVKVTRLSSWGPNYEVRLPQGRLVCHDDMDG